MRKHRVALVLPTVAVGIVAAVAGSFIALSASTQEATPSTSSALAVSQTPKPLPPIPSDRDQMTHIRAEYTAYTTTVLMNDEAALRTLSAAEAQAQASARAARAAEMSTAHYTATTSPPTQSSSANSCDPYSSLAGVALAEGIPCAWVPSAICEESARDDAYAGYFGILEWQGFDGYPSAGAAPLSAQLGWEAAHGQGPPDAPGQCHDY